MRMALARLPDEIKHRIFQKLDLVNLVDIITGKVFPINYETISEWLDYLSVIDSHKTKRENVVDLFRWFLELSMEEGGQCLSYAIDPVIEHAKDVSTPEDMIDTFIYVNQRTVDENKRSDFIHTHLPRIFDACEETSLNWLLSPRFSHILRLLMENEMISLLFMLLCRFCVSYNVEFPSIEEISDDIPAFKPLDVWTKNVWRRFFDVHLARLNEVNEKGQKKAVEIIEKKTGWIELWAEATPSPKEIKLMYDLKRILENPYYTYHTGLCPETINMGRLLLMLGIQWGCPDLIVTPFFKQDIQHNLGCFVREIPRIQILGGKTLFDKCFRLWDIFAQDSTEEKTSDGQIAMEKILKAIFREMLGSAFHHAYQTNNLWRALESVRIVVEQIIRLRDEKNVHVTMQDIVGTIRGGWVNEVTYGGMRRIIAHSANQDPHYHQAVTFLRALDLEIVSLTN